MGWEFCKRKPGTSFFTVRPNSMRYHEIFPLSRSELEKLLDSGNETAMIDALLSAAYYDPDWQWVESVCLRFLSHSDRGVRSNAVTCLGHIARIHKALDVEVVLPKLNSLKIDDPSIGHLVDDAIEGIRFFLRFQ